MRRNLDLVDKRTYNTGGFDMPEFRHMLLAALAIPALALGAVACGDDDDAAEGNSSPSAQDIDALTARMQRNEMATALLGIGNLPLHDIDEAIASGEEIPNDAVPSMRTVIRLISITDWAPNLNADADAVKESAEAFISAAEADDHGAVAEHSTAVHDGWHDFAEDAWDIVAPGTGGDDHSASETPTDEETPHSDAETPEATP
jgi:hypothetical protein